MPHDKAHGKDPLTANFRHLPCAERLPHGKASSTVGPTPARYICRVPRLGTRQLYDFAVCLVHSTRQIFFLKKVIQHSQLFLVYMYCSCYLMLTSGNFFCLFAIYNHLISLNIFIVIKSILNCNCF